MSTNITANLTANDPIARTGQAAAENTTSGSISIAGQLRMDALLAELAAAKAEDRADEIIGEYAPKYDALVERGWGDGCRCGQQVIRAKDACFRLFDACLDIRPDDCAAGDLFDRMTNAFALYESTEWTRLGDTEAQKVVGVLWTLCPVAKMYDAGSPF